MKVKYLKDAPLASAGTIADVLDNHANVLIRAGIAEAYTAPKSKPKKDDKKATNDSEQQLWACLIG